MLHRDRLDKFEHALHPEMTLIVPRQRRNSAHSLCVRNLTLLSLLA